MAVLYISEIGCQLNNIMKNNKGYYGWIHSMKNAAMESQFKAQQMLNEEKAIKKPFDKAKFDASMPKQPPVVSDDEPTVTTDRTYLEPTGAGTISLADGDVGLYVKLRRMRHAEEMAQRAQANGPVNAAPAGNANAVEADAQDGVMADPEFVPEPDRVHPEPWYKTPGEAAAAVSALNLQMKPRTPEEEAKADQQAADEEEMENIRREIRSMGESRKIVSSIINKILQENEDRDPERAPRKQSDRPKERKGKSVGKIESTMAPMTTIPGEGRTIRKGGVNFKALLDVYNNPTKYPPNISQAVQASFKDIFERGLGLPNN